MVHSYEILSAMPLVLPEKEIFSRLGYSRHRTVLAGDERKNLLAEMRRDFALCVPQGVWRTVEVKACDDAGFLLEDGIRLASADLVRHYRNCRKLWLGGVTIGSALPEWAAKKMAEQDTAGALIADAVGSETADAAMDFLQHYCAMQLASRGERMTERRFSPGYGDCDLTVQHLIFQWLPMEKLGVQLSPGMLMIPEKSVTAIAGIGNLCG